MALCENTGKVIAFHQKDLLLEERCSLKAHALAFPVQKSAYSTKIGIIHLCPKEATLLLYQNPTGLHSPNVRAANPAEESHCKAKGKNT